MSRDGPLSYAHDGDAGALGLTGVPVAARRSGRQPLTLRADRLPRGRLLRLPRRLGRRRPRDPRLLLVVAQAVAAGVAAAGVAAAGARIVVRAWEIRPAGGNAAGAARPARVRLSAAGRAWAIRWAGPAAEPSRGLPADVPPGPPAGPALAAEAMWRPPARCVRPGLPGRWFAGANCDPAREPRPGSAAVAGTPRAAAGHSLAGSSPRRVAGAGSGPAAPRARR